MRETLRAEFPGFSATLASLRFPPVAPESLGWAVLSAIGAGFVLEGIVRIALLPIDPLLFPATEPRPEWLTPSTLPNAVGALATGAVALRAGGPAAVGAYVAYELIRLLAALPGRVLFCERSGGELGLPDLGSTTGGCDYASLIPSVLIGHWPVWLGLAVGVVIARLVPLRDGGANWTLRGAGAFLVIGTVLGTTLGVALTGRDATSQLTFLNSLFAFIEILAAAVAGILLARSSLAAAALVAVLVVGPALSLSLPVALRGGFPSEPAEFALMRWYVVLIPLLAATALLASRAYARRRTMRTFP
jgi:hypothetical protein